MLEPSKQVDFPSTLQDCTPMFGYASLKMVITFFLLETPLSVKRFINTGVLGFDICSQVIPLQEVLDLQTGQ